MTKTWLENDDKSFLCQPLAAQLLDLSISRGGNKDTLLRSTGIFYEDIQRSDTALSFSQLFKLIANTEKQITSQDVSFLCGRRLFPTNLGQCGPLLMNARHLNDLIRLIQCYQTLLFPLMTITVERADDATWLIPHSAISNGPHDKFLLEMFCCAVNSACKWLHGRSVPIHFFFNMKRPKNIWQYEENLGHRLNFDQPATMIKLDHSWLIKPLQDTSPLIRTQQRREISAVREKCATTPGLLQFVRQEITREKTLSLDKLADTMNISPATLKRKLKQHGTSFQQMVDCVRKHKALIELSIKGEGSEQVARILQFSDLANFRRSFKRWTGMTPGEAKRFRAC